MAGNANCPRNSRSRPASSISGMPGAARTPMYQVPPWVTSASISRPNPGRPISMALRLSTSCGCVAARRKTVAPLMSCPVRWTGPTLSCPMRRCRSSADVVLSYAPGSLPESPKPRRSTAKTRWLAASSGMSFRKAHQVSGNPCTSRTGEPLVPAAT